MIIGFDGSRAFAYERTGTENYSHQLLKALAKIDKKNQYRIYLRPQSNGSRLASNNNFDGWPRNFEFKLINWSYLWTQGGLAIECLKNPPDVLFVPAHTMPVVRRPTLKTVVTIHDLGAEYLPEYHQFPQKYYLNWSTEYVARHADKIIAVSESTKRDLLAKLGCKEEKIQVVHEGVKKFH